MGGYAIVIILFVMPTLFQINQVLRGLKGGAGEKRARATESVIPVLMEQPTVQDSDIEAVRKAISVTSISISDWVGSLMDIDELKDTTQ